MSKRIINYKCDFCKVELRAFKMITFTCPNCGSQLCVRDKIYSEKLDLEIKKIKEEDVEKMKKDLGKVEKIISKDEFKGIKDIILKMIELLKNANVDFGIKAIIVAALTYVISPLDIIPDVIPFFGFLDDLAIIMIAAKLISNILGDNIDVFNIKRKNNIEMGSIIYYLVPEDKVFQYNYNEENNYKLWIIKSSDLERYNLKINENILPKNYEKYITHPYINKTLLPLGRYDYIIAESILNEYKEFARILGAKSIKINILDSNEGFVSNKANGDMKYKKEIKAEAKIEIKSKEDNRNYLFEEFGGFDKIHLEEIYKFMWIFTDMSFYDKLLESRINSNLLKKELVNEYSTEKLIHSDIRTSINKRNKLNIDVEISKFINRKIEINVEFFDLPKEIKEDRENIIKQFYKVMEIRRKQLQQCSVL